VRHTTDRFRHRAPFPLDGNTLVSEACRTGEQQLHQNAAHYGPSISVFEAGDGAWRQGPIGIVPLKRDKGVIGALVVAADAEEAITADELETLEVLGTVAAAQLEIVWEIDEVSKRARQDALTGLANRRSFDEHLRRLLNEAERFGQPLSLVLADIDHFKRINDTWGHEAGDEVLRRVARALQEGVRQVDVAARYGGEEIALLLPQTSMAGAADLADRLRRAVAGRPVKFKGEEIAVTLSFGVAAFPTSVRTRDGLFRAADQALYEAKAGGRNCVKVASGSNAQEAT
jgi:diguanylate cyclase (GGDEF)-like protein